MRESFVAYLADSGSGLSLAMMADLPSVFAVALESYINILWHSHRTIGEARHLIAYLKRDFPPMRPYLSGAWSLVTRWEIAEPLRHRTPLPETLYKAMVALALMWGWPRFAAVLTLAFEGVARIGEVLRAKRAQVTLPSDALCPRPHVFLTIINPKTARRGGALVQHIRVTGISVAAQLESTLGPLPGDSGIFGDAVDNGPKFRRLWDRVLNALQVPPSCGLLPGGIRGGGAVSAYDSDLPLENLLWRMRLASRTTLEHYLQEVSAINALGPVSKAAKADILEVAELLPALRLASAFTRVASSGSSSPPTLEGSDVKGC